jgi:hypothetical protein
MGSLRPPTFRCTKRPARTIHHQSDPHCRLCIYCRVRCGVMALRKSTEPNSPAQKCSGTRSRRRHITHVLMPHRPLHVGDFSRKRSFSGKISLDLRHEPTYGLVRKIRGRRFHQTWIGGITGVPWLDPHTFFFFGAH